MHQWLGHLWFTNWIAAGSKPGLYLTNADLLSILHEVDYNFATHKVVRSSGFKNSNHRVKISVDDPIQNAGGGGGGCGGGLLLIFLPHPNEANVYSNS